MFADFYFRFASESQAKAQLQALFDQGVWPSIDHIGVIYSQAGVPVDGWHVNVRLKAGQTIPAALTAYQIAAPLYPKRVWASLDSGGMV